MSNSDLRDLRQSEGWDSHYGRMVLEDTRLGIMPIGGRTRHPSGFLVRPAPGSSVDAPALAQAISARERYRVRDLASAVCEWISSCAADLLVHGHVEYEIVVDNPPGSATIRPRDWSQHPRRDNGTGHRVTLTLPGDLEREVSVLWRAMLALGDPFAPGHLLGYMSDDHGPKVPFDYDVFRTEEAHALGRATASVGWNARGTFHPKHGQNAYHFVLRELRFHGFKATLRSLAVTCLNDCLLAAGNATGSSMGIEVIGLPSTADVAAALAKLKEGHTSFGTLLDGFRF